MVRGERVVVELVVLPAGEGEGGGGEEEEGAGLWERLSSSISSDGGGDESEGDI